ncbi:hypothetical protein ACE1YR_22135 [Pseudomonas sp. K1(2024)]|uniref:Integrase n=1 Tax=Pseudomonas boreofloridensis TaxID=3064348 RepID=A0ABV4ZEN5_9PSED|nr:hypothetical protein [Pseudomonas sp. K13]MDO7904662.1 hypothetical protein [Pseudomonas sp. K13]
MADKEYLQGTPVRAAQARHGQRKPGTGNATFDPGGTRKVALHYWRYDIQALGVALRPYRTTGRPPPSRTGYGMPNQAGKASEMNGT